MDKKIAVVLVILLVLTVLLATPSFMPTTTAQPPTPSPQGVYHWKIELAQKKCNAIILGYLTRLGSPILGTEFELNCTCTGAVFWKVSTTVIPTDIHFDKWVDWNKDGIYEEHKVVDGILTQPTECHRWYQHNQTQTLVIEPVSPPPPPKPILGSIWHEIFPVPSREYELTSWEDTGYPYGDFSYCDQVDLTPYPGGGPKDWWHVDEVTPTFLVLNKMVVVEVHEQPYDLHDPFFYWQIMMKTHGTPAILDGDLTKDDALLPGTNFHLQTRNLSITFEEPDLQCQVVKTPYCTVPNDILAMLSTPGGSVPIDEWILQFPWTKNITIDIGRYVELELTEVQMHKYWVMGGQINSDGQLGRFSAWNRSIVSKPVPFATRVDWLSPNLMSQNITFTQKDPITGIVKIGIPANSYGGLDHVYFSTRVGFYFRVEIFLETQGCGWIFTGEGKEPILGSVDYRVFNNNTGVYTFGPDGLHSPTRDATWNDDELLAGKVLNPFYGQTGHPNQTHAAGAGAPLGPCLQGLRGPDGIPGTGDDLIGKRDPDGPDEKGSSIMFLPTTMRVTYWDGAAWVLLFAGPWPQLLTTGTAYDRLIEPNSKINYDPITGYGDKNPEYTETGQPWEFLRGADPDHVGDPDYSSVHWKDSHCNAYATYACVWSVLDVDTSLGWLDVHFNMREKKVRDYWVDPSLFNGLPPAYYHLPDVNCDEVVDIFDVVVCAATFGKQDEGFGNPTATPGYDARGDVKPDGLIDIFDFVVIASWFGAKLTNHCIVLP